MFNRDANPMKGMSSEPITTESLWMHGRVMFVR